MRRVSVARPGLRGVRLSNSSHPAPSTSSSAASPVMLDNLASVGVHHSQVNPRPVQRCTTAHGASSIELSHSSHSADAGSSPHPAIIMVCQTGVDDGRGLSAACTARELNVLSGLPPFNWSPSVASAERHRCALPCGKASTGCRASLRTSCWTRSVRDRLRCARSNAETASGFQTMCPLHWSRPVARAGQEGCVLLRRSALDGSWTAARHCFACHLLPFRRGK